jgi:hypothetical protein
VVPTLSSKILLNSPTWGVIIVSLLVISVNTLGISAEASSTSFVPLSLNFLTREFNASGFDIDIPIPIVAVFGIFGRLLINRFADPIVRVLSDMGNAMILGE